MKTVNILWAASLIITAVAALLFSVSGIFSLTLPEVPQRLIARTTMAGLPDYLYAFSKLIP